MDAICPKIILIGREALKTRPERVKAALALIDTHAAIVTNPEDAELAKKLTLNVVGFDKPVALVADFPGYLAIICDDGSVTPLELEEHATPKPNLITVVN